jgi:hypothetical protein
MMQLGRGRLRGPGPAVVAWGSLALFVVLFVAITLQLSSVGEPGRRSAVAGQAITREAIESQPSPDEFEEDGEGVESDEELEFEPPEPEVVLPEPEPEEAPAVVTSSS